MVCIIALCLESGMGKQSSPAWPPTPPYTWGGDQDGDRGPDPTLCRSEGSQTCGPSAQLCSRLLQTDGYNGSLQCGKALLEKKMNNASSSAHSTGMELGVGKGESREGKQDFLYFLLYLFPPKVHTSPPQSKLKCHLLSQQALLSPKSHHSWVSLLLP